MQNRLYYSYNDREYSFTYSGSPTQTVMIGFLKNSLKSLIGISVQEYLIHLEFDIEKCRICKDSYPPITVEFDIQKHKLKIKGFTYSKKIYCYGTNLVCKNLKLNPNSFEFISRVENISLDQAKEFLKANNKSPFYKENWSSDNDYKKFQSKSLGSYIEKYGIDKGTKKFNAHVNKISKANSEQGYIERYGYDIGTKIFKALSSKKDSMSFNYYLKKNKNDHVLALVEYEERKKSVNVSLTSLVEKYGESLGIEKHEQRIQKIKDYNDSLTLEEKEKRKFTLKNLIEKHGEIEGQRIYDSWRLKTVVKIGKASKESLKVFEPLMDIIKDQFRIDKNEIYIGIDGSREYFLSAPNEYYLYDFTILKHKIIIEFNGIKFHPKYENLNFWKPIFKGEDTIEIYNRNQRKVSKAIEKGFNVLEIWSDDTVENNIQKCLNFIKNIINN